ncbi:MAG TPA: hypothetical protein VG501_10060 [Rhizomicrobium sp.]|nr:hypothetical protein [Rhizomicrobium sp.]
MENPALQSDSERLLVLLAYGLMLIGPPMGGFTALIGVVIAHVRLGHAQGQLHESHYRNLIRVFWTMLIYALAMLTLFSFAAGYSVFWLFWPWFWPWHALVLGGAWVMFAWMAGLLSLAMVIWYYWRLITGFVRALDDRPY